MIKPVLISVRGGVAECVAGDDLCVIRDFDNEGGEGDSLPDFSTDEIAAAKAVHVKQAQVLAALLIAAKQAVNSRWLSIDHASNRTKEACEIRQLLCAAIDKAYVEKESNDE